MTLKLSMGDHLYSHDSLSRVSAASPQAGISFPTLQPSTPHQALVMA